MTINIIVHPLLDAAVIKYRMSQIAIHYEDQNEVSVFLNEELTEVIKQEKGCPTLGLLLSGYKLGRTVGKAEAKEND